MKIAFALPGFHRYDRGAEVALLSVADELARTGDDVTVFGSGDDRPGVHYRFKRVRAIRRERFERFPFVPPFRSETAWEDATFAVALQTAYRPREFDAAVTCSFPFTHLALRRPAGGRQPVQIFVTQNGDWPAHSNTSEYRLFKCDGLVCTNPDYLARNAAKWRSALIPNGIDPNRYAVPVRDRAKLGLPEAAPLVLMVSAMIESKRVLDGIRAVGRIEGAHLAVAGEGPLRGEAEALAAALLPGRFTRLSLRATEMPGLYAAADAFLHMSLLESFGNVFVEAMASGLPIVGHDTPRLRWIVGDRQFLCDTEDGPALDGALRAALARGRTEPDGDIARFSWPVIAQQYRAFLHDLAAR